MENDNPGQRLTKKQLKLARKLERLDQQKEGRRQNTVKWVIIGLACVLFFGFFTYLVISSRKQSSTLNVKINADDWIRGNPNAKVTLVEFGDLQCPACKAYEPIVRQLSKDFPHDLRLVYKEFPLSIHQNSHAAAYAAEAAGLQGKFWEMHDMLYDNQDEWAEQADPTPYFLKYATSLKLDLSKFKKDMDSSAVHQKVSSEEDYAGQIGINATPTFYLNNQEILQNPQSVADFEKLIQAKLK